MHRYRSTCIIMVVLHEEQVILAISSVVMSMNIKLVQQLPFKDIYTIKHTIKY